MEAAFAASVAAAAAAKDAAAVAVAVSVGAAAAMEAAFAASVAAAAAAKDAAAVAATTKGASTAAKEATAAASAAALNAEDALAAAKEAAVALSATALNAKAVAATALDAALNAKEAAAVAATAGEAAAMQVTKKRKVHLVLVDDQDNPRWSGNVDDQDLISSLPDHLLGIIVSLLPTNEGVRTQAISRRWRPLWRSTPLNLVADGERWSNGHRAINLIQKILSEHPGPGRRFSLNVDIWNCHDKMEGCLSSHALDNLQELELAYNLLRGNMKKLCILPSPAFRFAPTLRVAKFGGFFFPSSIVDLSLKFPCLKQLTVEGAIITKETLQSILSGCPALESLELKGNKCIGRLWISSQTLKSIGFCASWRNYVQLQELVIEDAPCLERLLPLDPEAGPATIRVISAPKLKILGVLSEDIAELQLGTTVFQKMIAVGLTTKMQTVRLLVLHSAGPNLNTVVNFLNCFPCLERLYVIFQSVVVMNNVRKYDPLDPIECLELHLKRVVLKNYDGTKSSCIDFAKFFILNAKVLKEMRITLPYHRQGNWFAKQHSRLQIGNRVSKDAQIELKCGSKDDFTHNKNTHDLSMADPFDMPSRGCSKRSCGPF